MADRLVGMAVHRSMGAGHKYELSKPLSHPKNRLAAYRKTHALEVWLDPDIERTQRSTRLWRCTDVTRRDTRHTHCGTYSSTKRGTHGSQSKLAINAGYRCACCSLFKSRPRTTSGALLQLSTHPVNDTSGTSARTARTMSPSRHSNQASVRVFRNHVAVVQKRAFCRYPAVEFKKDEGIGSPLPQPWPCLRTSNEWGEVVGTGQGPDAPLRHQHSLCPPGNCDAPCQKPFKPGLAASCPPSTLATAISLPMSNS